MSDPSNAAEPQAAVLDADAVASLRALDPQGRSRLLERVVEAFDTSANRLVPQLREAHAARDLQGIRHVAHTFKSSSASVGALALARQCAELETMIRDGQVDDLDRRVQQIIDGVAATVAALRVLVGAPARG